MCDFCLHNIHTLVSDFYREVMSIRVLRRVISESFLSVTDNHELDCFVFFFSQLSAICEMK